MYVPAHFVETRPEELARIIREHPLGVLVTHDAEGLDANHLPFEFDPGAGTHGMLTAHVARANPVWQRCALGSPGRQPVGGRHAQREGAQAAGQTCAFLVEVRAPGGAHQRPGLAAHRARPL